MAVVSMKKLTVFAGKSDTETLVRRLTASRCVSVQTTDLGEGVLRLERSNCDTQRTEAERRVAEIREVLPHLYKRSQRKKEIFPKLRTVDRLQFSRDGSAAAAWKTVREARAAADALAENRSEYEKTKLTYASLTPWLPYERPLDDTETEETVTVFGTLSVGVDAAVALDAYDAAVETVTSDKSVQYLVAVGVKSEEEQWNRALAEIGFLKLSFKGMSGTPESMCEKLTARLGVLEADAVRTEEKLCELARELERVEALFDIENTNLGVIRTRQKLAETDTCTVFDAWVPENGVGKVEKILMGYACAYEFSDPAPGDDPPVLLRNNAFAQNFEWVVGMYSYPKYGTFDPTAIMSIFYFLIFGLMFADVGYGLLLSAACFLAVRFLHPGDGMKRFLLMFGYCGISCMLMGVIFASYFGDFLSYFFGNALILTFDILEGNGPLYFLIICLGMGAVHLIAGMAVKFFILCRKGRIFDAVFDIASWWLVFAGIGLIFVPGAAVVGYVLLGLGGGLILLFAGRDAKNPILRIGKGLLGLYDGVGYVSDLLSYSRIMALGLAAAVIAKVVNQIGFMVGNSPIGFIFMVLIFIVGHLLNLVINLLGTFVHTSRLQYIEFFGKFYEDGGTPFSAELPSEQYSRDVSDGDGNN